MNVTSVSCRLGIVDLAMQLEAAVTKFVEQCLELEAEIMVALSGGLDSVSLLNLLVVQARQSPISLSAVHIHHGLSANADKWQAFCAELCNKHQIEFLTTNCAVSVNSRESLEDKARQARYRAIEQHAKARQRRVVLALGQHQDDQAETVLLQLARGAGPKGLSAMPAFQQIDSKLYYARPLLACSQASLRAYAHTHQLTWVEDESNNDQSFDRNFLRGQVMPVFYQRWPQFSQSLHRSARLCAEQESVIAELLDDSIKHVINADNCLILSRLQCFSTQVKRQLLRYWIDKHDAQLPSLAQLNELLKQLDAPHDSQSRVQLGNMTAARCGDHLHLVANAILKPYEWKIPEFEQVMTANSDVVLPINEHCQISIRLSEAHSDSRLRVSGMAVSLSQPVKFHSKRPRKAIKVWLQEASVPPWLRDALMLICIEQEAIGLFVIKQKLFLRLSDDYPSVEIAVE